MPLKWWPFSRDSKKKKKNLWKFQITSNIFWVSILGQALEISKLSCFHGVYNLAKNRRMIEENIFLFPLLPLTFWQDDSISHFWCEKSVSIFNLKNHLPSWAPKSSRLVKKWDLDLFSVSWNFISLYQMNPASF